VICGREEADVREKLGGEDLFESKDESVESGVEGSFLVKIPPNTFHRPLLFSASSPLFDPSGTIGAHEYVGEAATSIFGLTAWISRGIRGKGLSRGLPNATPIVPTSVL
jgi:hypothetical protein